MVALHVAGGGVLLRWAPWTSHLEGNCCAFRLARPGSPERATPQLAHTEKRTLKSAKPLLPAPPDWQRGKKNNTGWFVQVIIFIPEQLEDTSLNVLPRELSESQRSELGASRGGGGTTLCSSELHTHTTQRIPENPRAARDPPSCPSEAGGGNYSSEKSLSMSMYASSM